MTGHDHNAFVALAIMLALLVPMIGPGLVMAWRDSRKR
jgi:hypothetical protein